MIDRYLYNMNMSVNCIEMDNFMRIWFLFKQSSQTTPGSFAAFQIRINS